MFVKIISFILYFNIANIFLLAEMNNPTSVLGSSSTKVIDINR